MSNYYGKWQPIGDQFPWACRVCVNRGSLECMDCRCEKTSGFEFDPHQYVKLCQEQANEKYFFDGEKFWCVGGCVMVKHPCQGCIYFKACGENTRTEPCHGRMTKREARKNK